MGVIVLKKITKLIYSIVLFTICFFIYGEVRAYEDKEIMSTADCRYRYVASDKKEYIFKFYVEKTYSKKLNRGEITKFEAYSDTFLDLSKEDVFDKAYNNGKYDSSKEEEGLQCPNQIYVVEGSFGPTVYFSESANKYGDVKKVDIIHEEIIVGEKKINESETSIISCPYIVKDGKFRNKTLIIEVTKYKGSNSLKFNAKYKKTGSGILSFFDSETIPDVLSLENDKFITEDGNLTCPKNICYYNDPLYDDHLSTACNPANGWTEKDMHTVDADNVTLNDEKYSIVQDILGCTDEKHELENLLNSDIVRMNNIIENLNDAINQGRVVSRDHAYALVKNFSRLFSSTGEIENEFSESLKAIEEWKAEWEETCDTDEELDSLIEEHRNKIEQINDSFAIITDDYEQNPSLYSDDMGELVDFFYNFENSYETVYKDVVSENTVGCDFIDSEIWAIIRKILRWVQLSVPVIIIGMGSVDFAKAVLADDQDAIKKATTTFIKRLVIGAAIFFLPSILELILNLVELPEVQGSLCRDDLGI